MSNKFILVINCGSSSIKFALFNIANKKKILSGLAERLFLEKSNVIWKINKTKHQNLIVSNASHKNALDFIINGILKKNIYLFKNIIGIGHRIVHGGNKITKSLIINDKIVKLIKDAIIFSPLHNPINLIGIDESMKNFPHLFNKNVGVFDTVFHRTIPKTAHMYAIPYMFYNKYNIKRYGAHGISHNYVMKKTSKILNKNLNSLNIIICHLGNGSSIAAVKNGICVDTSMGLTPLEGLVMGTRSGDIDPYIIFYMNKILGFNMKKISNILINKSGLLGLNGVSSDCRYIAKNYYCNKLVKLSLDIFCYRLSKYISSYFAIMVDRLDAIIFTGGIGENSYLVREKSLSKLALMGVFLDNEKNIKICKGKYGLISKLNSIPVLVVKTNEELAIAEDTIKLILN
ncbi:acetate kinase [Buchnera aphidicola (Neophyllaphis podocarpi)]|uniref:acetate kinase n=1 Tax=Buchnera aphidicola TaxID=9 RepID=UPI0031B87DA9